jgi:serine/threonine protein kinase
MQNCSGRSLAELIEKRVLTATQQQKACVSLVKRLAFLHAQSVPHRDPKPSNVSLDEAGNAPIGDFGSARAAELGMSQIHAAQTFSAVPRSCTGTRTRRRRGACGRLG